MTQVQSPMGTTVYGYDDENIRVSSLVGGLTTHFLLDRNRDYSQVLAESRNGTVQASYVYGLDLLSQKRGGTESFYLVDGLGSTRGLTDVSGGLTDSYTYDAFGNLVGSAGSTSNTYLFAGEQLDTATGDYYLRQRFYDASSGRFTRRDTYEGDTFEPITLNKYLYGNGNPVNYTDLSGLYSIGEAIAGTIALTAILAIPSSSRHVLTAESKALIIPKVTQIKGYYDRVTGTLTLYDLNSPSPVIINCVFSGKEPYKNDPNSENVPNNGVIPHGSYEIFKDEYREGWYRLDRIDSIPRNDKDDDLYGRSGFRLHPGTLSLGCITIPNSQQKDWDKVISMLEGTNKETGIRDRRGLRWWLRNKKLTKYGQIEVY